MKQIKFLSILMLVLVGLSFTACSSSDDDENGSTEDASLLVGIWVQDRGKFYTGIKIESNGGLYYNEWSTNEEPWFGTRAGKWYLEGGKLIGIDPAGETFEFTYSISEDGKTLILSGGKSYNGTYKKYQK